MLDFYEKKALLEPAPEADSLVKGAFYRIFGRPVYFLNFVKILHDSNAQAHQEAQARNEAHSLDEQFGLDDAALVTAYGSESDEAFMQRRREELFSFHHQELLEQTLSYGRGSRNFLGKLVMQIDD